MKKIVAVYVYLNNDEDYIGDVVILDYAESISRSLAKCRAYMEDIGKPLARFKGYKKSMFITYEECDSADVSSVEKRMRNYLF